MASNENPFGCSPKVTAYLQNNAVNHALYPDGYAQNLRTAVANHLGVKETQLLLVTALMTSLLLLLVLCCIQG